MGKQGLSLYEKKMTLPKNNFEVLFIKYCLKRYKRPKQSIDFIPILQPRVTDSSTDLSSEFNDKIDIPQAEKAELHYADSVKANFH